MRELGEDSQCLLAWNPIVDSVRPLDEQWFHETFPHSSVGIRSQFEVSAPGRIPSNVYVFHSDPFVNLLENEILSPAVTEEVNVRPAGFQELTPSHPQEEPRNLDLLLDVGLTVRVELGRTSLRVQEVLELGPGSVVELDKLAGEPVDLLVNEQLFARGEVVVIDENFGVRVTDIVSPQERINAMRRG
jgi:flagellar motor switch protein FliN/FliY